MLAKTIPFYFRQPVLENVSQADIRRAVEKYPYASTLQLLLLKKMQQENDPGQSIQWEKCSLYFPNPFLLQAMLDGYGTPTTLPAIPVVTGDVNPDAEEEDIPLVGKVTITEAAPPAAAAMPVEVAAAETTAQEEEPADYVIANVTADEWNLSAETHDNPEEVITAGTTPTTAEAPANETAVQEEEPADYIVANTSSDEWNLSEAEEAAGKATVPEEIVTEQPDDEPEALPESDDELRMAVLLRESPIPIPGLKDVRPETGDQPLFEPYHTIDYFASQGIRLSNELPADDKLGRQMKSFTDWIRSMKRLPQARMEEKLLETARGGEQVVAMAAGSIRPQEVTTETMAEVLVKQGNIAKAIDIYHKLSLAYPHKSVYFASRIEQLKKD